MRVLTPHTTHCRRKFAYRLFELVGDDRFFPGPRVESRCDQSAKSAVFVLPEIDRQMSIASAK